MTSISLTSGEILDIISALEIKENDAFFDGNPPLASYYLNLQQQFQKVYDKLQEEIPENRVANLVLARN